MLWIINWQSSKIKKKCFFFDKIRHFWISSTRIWHFGNGKNQKIQRATIIDYAFNRKKSLKLSKSINDDKGEKNMIFWQQNLCGMNFFVACSNGSLISMILITYSKQIFSMFCGNTWIILFKLSLLLNNFLIKSIALTVCLYLINDQNWVCFVSAIWMGWLFNDQIYKSK